MRKYFTIIINKFTLGHTLGILASFIFAVLLKFGLQHLFDITVIKGGLCISDIAYFFSIASWRFLFTCYLEFLLGEQYHMPLQSSVNKENFIALFADKGVAPVSNENLPSSNRNSENSDFIKSVDIQIEMMSNLKYQSRMMQKLVDLKMQHDLKYFDVKGALELEGPASLTDSQLGKLSQEVGVIDRIIHTKIGEYASLEKQFLSSLFIPDKVNKSLSDFKELHDQRYKSLFEKDK